MAFGKASRGEAMQVDMELIEVLAILLDGVFFQGAMMYQLYMYNPTIDDGRRGC